LCIRNRRDLETDNVEQGIKMKIRKTIQNDADAIRSVHLAAFPEGERDLISDVAVEMLSEAASPPVFSLVAEVDETIIGHIAFSPVTSCDTKEHLGYILAPLAVSPSHQKRGIASQLINSGIDRLSELGSGVLLVYGDPDFFLQQVRIWRRPRRVLHASLPTRIRVWMAGDGVGEFRFPVFCDQDFLCIFSS
jgi:predicted N-acetyltransferase YhbS